MALDPNGIYYGVGGQRHGPVDLDSLRAMIAEGAVGADDYVWDDDRDDWEPIRRYPVLLEPEAAVESPADLEPGLDTGPVVDDLPYAGFGVRLVAWVIDVLVLLIPVTIWELTVESITGVRLEDLALADPSASPAADPRTVEFLLWFHVGAAVIRGLYWSWMEQSQLQATLGKKMLGLVVTDERGHRAPWRQTAVRYVGRLLCELTLGVGYLLILVDPRHQGLHDRIARTLVVRT